MSDLFAVETDHTRTTPQIAYRTPLSNGVFGSGCWVSYPHIKPFFDEVVENDLDFCETAIDARAPRLNRTLATDMASALLAWKEAQLIDVTKSYLCPCQLFHYF